MRNYKRAVSAFIVFVILVGCFGLVSCAQKETDYEAKPAFPLSYDMDEERTGLGKIIGEENVQQFYDENRFESNEFAINDGILFEPDICAPFNKVIIKYMSDVPAKLLATYILESNETVEDTLYLESGKKVFEFLIIGYEQGLRAAKLSSMQITRCKDNGHFIAWSYAVTDEPLCLDKTIYIYNGKYKAGIDMVQGGGLNYISDSSLRLLKNRNLLNNFDAGRLVQQSYYGTEDNEEYQSGEFNNAHWRYNPVQGGDKYQNTSRIIHFVVNEHSIYVKCQPMDWSLDNFCTPSYMESTYTVYPDRIGVNCRFVDFSGWDNPVCTQEIPAFYTISYLDTFTLYKGNEPWQNKELSALKNLPFWGNPQNYDYCYQYFNENSENWCAWTYKEDKYGIGLYSPDCTSMVFGRSGDGHSKKSGAASCSYVAPLIEAALTPYEAYEYSYLITTGSIEEIRSIFYQYKDFDAQS